MASSRSEVFNGVSVLRVLRILRVVRIARVIRVMKFFKELRVMVYSILGCVKNLIWVLVVLLLTFYIFGVAFTSAVTDYLDTTDKWWEASSDSLLLDYFGTINRSLLTLFMAMTGGDDWRVFYDTMSVLGMPYQIAFLIFIVFSLFAVVNIVTGVFVESALESNVKDRDIVVSEELHTKKEYLKSMEEIFEEMDEDGHGTISMQEFEHKLKDERVIAYFKALKLDVTDAAVLFNLLDVDRSNEISIKEFLDGCYNLQGESRNLDVKIMQYEVKFLKERFEDFDFLLNEVSTKLSALGKALRLRPPSPSRPPSRQRQQLGLLTVPSDP